MLNFQSRASGNANLPVVEGSWSGSAARKALAKWASSDGSGDKEKVSWSKYAQGFFWYDEKDPENFGSYKLPFATVRQGRLVAVKSGIVACAASIQGARGGVNIPKSDMEAVKRKIARYYKKMGMTPPWGKRESEEGDGFMKLIELHESFKATFVKDSTIELAESRGIPKALRITLEAVHSAITSNFTFYPADRLQGSPEYFVNGRILPTGVHSWLKPYPKPVLVDHNDFKVDAALGRVNEARYVEKTTDGLPGVVLTCTITDPDAIERILDGRYYTVSVGLSTDAAYCSICGANQAQGYCGHDRGQEYDGKVAYWTSGNIWFKEVSFVNNPADPLARVVSIAPEKRAAKKTAESVVDAMGDAEGVRGPRLIYLAASQMPGFSSTKEEVDVGKEEHSVKEHEQKETAGDEQSSIKVSNEGLFEAAGVSLNFVDKLMSHFASKESVDAIQEGLKEIKDRLARVAEEIAEIKERSRSSEEVSLSDGQEDQEQEESSATDSEETSSGQSQTGGSDAGDGSPEAEDGGALGEDTLAELRQSLARRIVEARTSLGRIVPEAFHAEVERYTSKSIDYLKDALEDVMQDIRYVLKDSESRREQGPNSLPRIKPVGIAAIASERGVKMVKEDEEPKAAPTSIDVKELSKRLQARR